MPRRMQALDRDIAQLENFAVANAAEWKSNLGISEQHVLGTGGLRQIAARGDVICVHMRIDHTKDAHSGFVGRLQILSTIPNRVDDGGSRTAPAAKEIRRCNRIGVPVLTPDHYGPATS